MGVPAEFERCPHRFELAGGVAWSRKSVPVNGTFSIDTREFTEET